MATPSHTTTHPTHKCQKLSANMYSGKYTPVPIPPPVLTKTLVYPLLKIYIWRCANVTCRFKNETLGTEEGKFRVLPSGNELREPCFYHEKCEFCREEAGRECCLLEVRLLEAIEKDTAVVDEGKGKKEVDEDGDEDMMAE
jgi:hypothetical protein